jgi:hypothetical protein
MFNEQIKPHVGELFNLKPEQLLCLPTGDGAALTFIHVDGDPKWTIETIVDIIFDLQTWAHKFSQKDESELKLRIGVHVGPVEMFNDINDRPNVCGSAINTAQRVMDAAHPRQVLFSEDAVEHYIGKESATWKISAQRHKLYRIGGPFEVHAKHGKSLWVYRLLPDGIKGDGWSNEDPEIKFWLSVSPSPAPKPIVGEFAERLSKAKDVALVQLTGERLLSALKNGDAKFSDDLRRLWVFLPHHRHCVTPTGKLNQKLVSKLNRLTKEWRRLASSMRKRQPKAEIEVREYQSPPYFGASFLDWEERGGFVHISPYIWGVEAAQCPGFNINWVGSNPLPLYRTYVKGLMGLHSNSRLLGLTTAR